MRFLCLYKPGKMECAPTQQEMIDMGNLIQEAMNAGWLLSTEGCLPSEHGARVRFADGKYTTTDGPFAETKELIGGFAIIQADSKKQAIEHTKYFLKVAAVERPRFARCTRRQNRPARPADFGCLSGRKPLPLTFFNKAKRHRKWGPTRTAHQIVIS